ncbi:hypothetical protein BDK51DRAFT_31582, partial [Blyttiomyces helicus]
EYLREVDLDNTRPLLFNELPSNSSWASKPVTLPELLDPAPTPPPHRSPAPISDAFFQLANSPILSSPDSDPEQAVGPALEARATFRRRKASPISDGSGGPSRNQRSRKKEWDLAYERKRKLENKRGHGTNLVLEQKLRFPKRTALFTHADAVDQLLDILSNAQTEAGGNVAFTSEAFAQAKYRVSVSGKQPWRVWLPDGVWVKFQALKCACSPTETTHAEFAELLLQFAGYQAGGESSGIRKELIEKLDKPKQQPTPVSSPQTPGSSSARTSPTIEPQNPASWLPTHDHANASQVEPDIGMSLDSFLAELNPLGFSPVQSPQINNPPQYSPFSIIPRNVASQVRYNPNFNPASPAGHLHACRKRLSEREKSAGGDISPPLAAATAAPFPGLKLGPRITATPQPVTRKARSMTAAAARLGHRIPPPPPRVPPVKRVSFVRAPLALSSPSTVDPDLVFKRSPVLPAQNGSVVYSALPGQVAAAPATQMQLVPPSAPIASSVDDAIQAWHSLFEIQPLVHALVAFTDPTTTNVLFDALLAPLTWSEELDPEFETALVNRISSLVILVVRAGIVSEQIVAKFLAARTISSSSSDIPRALAYLLTTLIRSRSLSVSLMCAAVSSSPHQRNPDTDTDLDTDTEDGEDGEHDGDGGDEPREPTSSTEESTLQDCVAQLAAIRIAG